MKLGTNMFDKSNFFCKKNEKKNFVSSWMRTLNLRFLKPARYQFGCKRSTIANVLVLQLSEQSSNLRTITFFFFLIFVVLHIYFNFYFLLNLEKPKIKLVAN